MSVPIEGGIRAPSIRVFLAPDGRWAGVVYEAANEQARITGCRNVEAVLAALRARWPHLDDSVARFEPSLDDWAFEIARTPTPRPYPHFRNTVTATRDRKVLLVNLRKLNDALRGDPGWAASKEERWQSTFKAQKYALNLREVEADVTLYRPRLLFKEGRIRICDGRHRLYALMDSGYTHAEIVADPPHVGALETLVDTAHGHAGDVRDRGPAP